MGRVVSGARRVPAEAARARDEAALVRAEAAREAEGILAEARARAGVLEANARSEGRAAGFAEAATVLAEAREARARAAKLREPEIAELALAVARRVIGDCRMLDPDLVARRVADAIRRRFPGPVVVRARRTDAERIRRLLERDGAGGRAVEVREDDGLDEGTCVLEGDGGEVRLDDDEMLARVGRAMGGGREADR